MNTINSHQQPAMAMSTAGSLKQKPEQKMTTTKPHNVSQIDPEKGPPQNTKLVKIVKIIGAICAATLGTIALIAASLHPATLSAMKSQVGIPSYTSISNLHGSMIGSVLKPYTCALIQGIAPHYDSFNERIAAAVIAETQCNGTNAINFWADRQQSGDYHCLNNNTPYCLRSAISSASSADELAIAIGKAKEIGNIKENAPAIARKAGELGLLEVAEKMISESVPSAERGQSYASLFDGYTDYIWLPQRSDDTYHQRLTNLLKLDAKQNVTKTQQTLELFSIKGAHRANEYLTLCKL